MTNEKLSDTIHRLNFKDGRQILLVGTAHVSKESVNEVASYIDSEKPDHICLELDDGRFKNKEDEGSWSNMDIKKVLKEKKGFLLITNMALASFQKRMGNQSGSAPGEEILGAARIAKEKEIPYSLCDREIQITFKRAWRKSNLWNKAKLIATIISAVFSKEEISEAELEELKKSDVMQGMLDEMAKELPAVKTVLIDERDRYLATSIYQAPGTKILAVIGAGHQNGIISCMQKLEDKQLSADLSEITEIPPAGKAGKILSWAFPAFIVGILLYGFFQFGQDQGIKMFGYWLATNMSFTALGAILSLAHPLNILVSIVTAPLASLHPAIGIGMVSGLMEATLRKPKVKDFETLSDDALKLKGWYKNRVLHILLVFLLTSIFATVGNVVVFPILLSMLG
ncbi:pheromone shutdown-related protein TraB [Sphaerochaeta pleomorpha str. Grapes]|uniref:Pheromone shutdown-related protein TraB n=1 Tax=Sphaerochaeta pleomorpha (strain ATCC BAA-1885 / DSM 22778 / Grapes) TaxID=158190 RepID=G8QYU6_SPHPG|nr:TraB/GumN family protein [Sphaerochaeta pleomorpha]AEV29723.1 pheromone shutdown-related protein TraB [Sphaerochaeta pleomorpha str. Grapes]